MIVERSNWETEMGKLEKLYEDVILMYKK